MDDPAYASFAAANSPRLREAGLKGGYATVSLRDGTLEFVGAEGGGVRLLAGKVDRLRLGYTQGRAGQPHFQALIWPAGEGKPILVLPLGEAADKAAFGAAMRAYAAALTQAHGLGRVERGISGLAALAGLLLVSFPVALYAIVSVRSADRENWIGALAGGLVLAGVTGAFYWAYQGRSAPRRIKDLTELERLTPGPNFRL